MKEIKIEHLYKLWQKTGNKPGPKGYFIKRCPVCNGKIHVRRYKAGEEIEHLYKLWMKEIKGDAVYDYLYYSCSCGYEYCVLKVYAKVLHNNPKYSQSF